MKQRIITATVLLCLFVPVLIFSGNWVFPSVIALLSVFGVYEMLRCLNMHKNFFYSVPALVFAAFFPVGAYIFRRSFGYFLLLFGLCAAVYMLYAFMLAVLSEGKAKFSDVAETVVTLYYIVFGFTAIVLTRHLPFSDDILGRTFFLLIFIGAWITDTFAYFIGRAIGKHKLCPLISPKKTVEGSVGGIIFCVISYIVFALIVRNHVAMNVGGFIALMAVSGLFISVISQMGDLLASLIKREKGIKDYGRIFPGHGGVMDRFDSILSVSILLFAIFAACNFLGIVI